MNLELAFIEIEKLIAHIVRRPDENGIKVPPVLTEKIRTLDEDSKALFRVKIVEHIDNKKAIQVKTKEETKNNILEEIRVLQSLNRNTNEYKNRFVAISRIIANLYLEIIDRRSKDCLIIFFEIRKRQQIKHAILIFELQVGVQAILNETDGTIDIDYIKGLILSRKTRLFKIAYCIFENGYDAIVCDTQSSRDQIVANYFIDELLECEFIEIPEISTKNFFNGTLGFINTIQDNEMKYVASTHLYSYIHSDEEIIGPREFAEKLQPRYRQDYLDYLTARRISLTAFQKDITRIRSDIRRERIDFDDNISLIAPPKQIKDKIKIKKIGDDEKEVSVSFQSRIKQIK